MRAITQLFPLAFVVASLTACADQVQFGDPPFEPVEPAAVDAVSSAYTDCLTREAERIDDGKLSPIGLALKVIPACEKQFAALQAVAASGSGRFQGHAIRDNLELEKEEYATRVVLRERLDRALPP